MANSYYNNDTNTIINGTLASASDVEDKFDDVVTGLDLVEDDITDSIKLTNADVTNYEITEAAATRANKAIGFDSSGDMTLLVRKGTFQGDWATATFYSEDDTVKDAAGAAGAGDDAILVCLANHTSTDLASDIANWDTFIDVSDLEDAVTAAENAQADAETAQTAAELAETNAETAQTAAELAETNAETAEIGAEAAETGAEAAETAALASEAAAATSVSDANKWAVEDEDTSIDDGVHPVDYSAYHYAQKARTLSGGGVLDLTTPEFDASAVDFVFLYDTALDDDGGAWVHKATHQSWYTETLSTSIRGGSRPFPALALITATESKITIYNGDDEDLPMWMVINRVSDADSGGFWGTNGSTSIQALTGITAKNGDIIFSTNTESSEDYSGVHVLHFITDDMERHSSYNTSEHDEAGHRWGLPIWQRDEDLILPNQDILNVLVSGLCNDVDVKSDGHMGNMIAVATEAGVSVIKPNGEIVDLTYEVSTNDESGHVRLTNGGGIRWSSLSSGTGYTYIQEKKHTPEFDDSTIYDVVYHSSHATLGVGIFTESGDEVQCMSKNGVGSTSNLTLIDDTDPDDILIANINNGYNSGWMLPGTKGAWLNGIDYGGFVTNELVTNGTFTTDMTGWTDSDVTSIVISGQARVTRAGTTGWTYQTFTTVVGQTYTASFKLRAGTSSDCFVNIGDSVGGDEHISIENTSTDSIRKCQSFVATATTTYVSIGGNTDNGTAYFDNIEIREGEFGMAPSGQSIQTYGTITRARASNQSDRMFYSSFSSNDYCKQPPNTDFDFDEDDFHFMAWFDRVDETRECLMERTSDGGTPYIRVEVLATNLMRFTAYGDTASKSVTVNDEFPAVGHTFVFCQRKDDVGYVYVNGVLAGQATFAGTGSMDETLAMVWLGIEGDGSSNPMDYSGLSAVRFGSGSTSSDNIKRIYEMEKPMYSKLAVCTIPGTEPGIVAIDQDDTDDSLTVCTSDYVVKMEGLLVVDSDADDATSVSTNSGKRVVGE